MSFAAFVVFLALFHLAAAFVPELRAWSRTAFIAGIAGWGIGWYFQKKEAELEQHIAALLARGNPLPPGERTHEMRMFAELKRLQAGAMAERDLPEESIQ